MEFCSAVTDPQKSFRQKAIAGVQEKYDNDLVEDDSKGILEVKLIWVGDGERRKEKKNEMIKTSPRLLAWTTR